MTQVLEVNQLFLNMLDKEEHQKILRIYGYNNKEEFLNYCIKKLNEEYDYLNISSYKAYDKKHGSEYHMYNGFINGDIPGFDLVTVSFTTIQGKNGNVFMSQQLIPMVTSKLNKSKDFLLNKKIKRICLLTTHKSKKMSPSANYIDRDSTIQMSIKFANILGFDCIDIFHINNLNSNGYYNNIDELLDNLALLQKKKKTNNQFNQISYSNNIYTCSFGNKKPKGQEAKFLAFKILACLHLEQGKNINIDLLLGKTNDITITVLDDYIKYLNDTNITEYKFNYNDESDFSLEVDDDIIERTEPDYIYNKLGKKVFKTKKIFKTKSFEKSEYMCLCHDDKHTYFTSNSSKKNYLEGHHIIPMEFQNQYWDEKQVLLDREENLVALCPFCHNKIHKAISREKYDIIKLIYDKREDELKAIDPSIDIDKLASLYNVYIY